MGVICTYRQPGKSFTLPHYDWQRTVQEFGIKPDDRVLDVGGGDMPFERANVVTDAFLTESHHRGGRPIRQDKHYVECRVESLPFADKEFDFVYCNHVLEHTDDPIAACRELIRVAKRGYIEVPSYWAEYVFSDAVHYWMIDWVDDTLVFRSKPYRQATRQDTPFQGIVHKYWEENRQEFILDWQVGHRNLWTIQILWDGDGFTCRVEELPADTIADSPAGLTPLQSPEGIPLSNAFGKVYPLSHPEVAAKALGIRPSERVLVIASQEPSLTPNAVRVAPSTIESLAFEDQAFDFAYCAEALEFTRDPAAACEALMRVAKRGLIEVTHTWAALMLGAAAHQWLVEVNDGVLTFRRRRFLDHPFQNVLRGEYYGDPDFQYRYDVGYRNVSRIQLAWEGRFAYQVIDEGHEFDYRRPEQAALSHLRFAQSDRKQGVPLEHVVSELQKALDLDPRLEEARQELAVYRPQLPAASGPMGFGISAIVHTLNEEARVEDALKSLQGWVDEIIVVDMHSEDRTLEIARRYTERVYLHERVRDFDGARNFSADLAQYPWIFYLDADERVPEAMGPVLHEVLASQGDSFSAVQLPYKNHFAGHWIQHAGQWWPGYKAPMLLKKGTFRWEPRMHAGARIDGAIMRFPCDNPDLAITHYAYTSVGHLIQKQNNYTDAEADYLHQDGKPFHWKTAVAGFVEHFKTYYDATSGAADGPHGFLLAFFAGFYQFAAQAKLFERRYRANLLSPAEREVPANLEEVLQFALAVLKGEAAPPVLASETNAPTSLLQSTFPEASQDLMDYLGLAAEELIRRIETCNDELRSRWLQRNPQTEQELREYYGEVEGYLYGLTTFNYLDTYLDWRKVMVRHCEHALTTKSALSVLDYGAGIGTNLLDLTRIPGVRGVHADVPGKNLEYATWRYRRHGSPVVPLAIQGDDPLGNRQFDLILCIDVLEHLKDPIQAIRYLIDHLRPGGTLIATVWFELENPEDKDIIHLNTDTFTNASFWEHVATMGMDFVEGDDQFRVYSKPPSPPILWQAPLFDPSGYADEARSFLLGLDAIGAKVKAYPLNWSQRIAPLDDTVRDRLHAMTERSLAGDYVNVVHIFPPYYQRQPEATWNIGRTMFETDRIPADWVDKCNAMDEVWVPSDFNLETFALSGVRREKLFKVPGSLDPARFKAEIEPLDIEGKRAYNFLSVFDWSLRKGWDVLLRAYLEEFKAEENVALVLKVYSSSGLSIEDIQTQVIDYVQALGMDPEAIPDILFLDANMSEESILRLYKAADAYVMPTRGEGWGRPLMDAMAMGLPTIATGWSGNTEFMTSENSYPIDFQLTEVSEEACREAHTFRGHRWAEPSVNHLRALMRHVFVQRGEAKARGARARQEVLAKYDRQVIARLITERLNALTHTGGPIRGIWEGGQFIHHSLAYVNRELTLGLLGAGQVDLSIMATGPTQFDESADPRFIQLKQRFGSPLPAKADFHLRHEFPPQFTPPPEGHWIMIQPWEFGGLPKEWLAPMRDVVDEIWVPTRFVRDGYLQSGIAADKVHVVPNGVDTQLFKPEGRKATLSTKKSFKFLYVGGTIYRKGIDILINSYINAFKAEDDVCLVIKDFCTTSVYVESNLARQIQVIRENPQHPEILYLNDDLPGEELAALYRACDALVHPYRGEGFGLPIAEAMACGLPVIVPDYGACLDFCDPETAILVPAKIVPLPELQDMPPTAIGYWVSEIHHEDLIKVMREAPEQPERLRAIGQKASARIHRDFTWEQATQKALDRLHELRKKPILRFLPDFVDPQIFHPGIEALQFEGKRRHNFLALPEWPTGGWLAMLEAYLEAFRSDDDVALVLRVDPSGAVSTEQAQDKLLEAIAMLGHDPEQIPDILVVDAPLTPEREGALYTACQALISSGEAAHDRKALACGLDLVTMPTREVLRAALDFPAAR